MNTQQLDTIVEDVVQEFTSEIMNLNNNEVEYVLRELVNKFDGLLERVSEANLNEM